MTIRILLADDQAMVRQALAGLLALEEDFDVVAQVGRGDEVLPAVTSYRPDVVVLDVDMPGMDGLSVAEALQSHHARARILIVTTFGRPGWVSRALAAGVAGFVVKDAPINELAEAIRRVDAGLRVVDPELAVSSMAAGTSPLTGREADVLRVLEVSGSAAQVARELHLSPGTVRNHVSAAIAKTNARSGADAARLARDNGWI